MVAYRQKARVNRNMYNIYIVCTRSSSPQTHTHRREHRFHVISLYKSIKMCNMNFRCGTWMFTFRHIRSECPCGWTQRANYFVRRALRKPTERLRYQLNTTQIYKHTPVGDAVRRSGASLVDVGNLLSIRRGKREITHRRSQKSDRGRKISRETRTGAEASKGGLLSVGGHIAWWRPETSGFTQRLSEPSPTARKRWVFAIWNWR